MERYMWHRLDAYLQLCDATCSGTGVSTWSTWSATCEIATRGGGAVAQIRRLAAALDAKRGRSTGRPLKILEMRACDRSFAREEARIRAALAEATAGRGPLVIIVLPGSAGPGCLE